MAGVINYWGGRESPESIKKEIYIERLKGSLALDLALAARKRGLNAEIKEGSIELIKNEILQNRPPIALLNEGLKSLPQGHFILITGFDDEKGGVFAHSGNESEKFIPYRKFLKGWKKAGRTLLLISRQ